MRSRSVHVWVRNSNQNVLILLDQARRCLDLLGGIGIRIKRGETNVRYLRRGYLRFVFPTRQMALRYQKLVEDYCASSVLTRRYKPVN